MTVHCTFLFVAEIPSEAVDAVRVIQDALMDEVWDCFSVKIMKVKCKKYFSW